MLAHLAPNIWFMYVTGTMKKTMRKNMMNSVMKVRVIFWPSLMNMLPLVRYGTVQCGTVREGTGGTGQTGRDGTGRDGTGRDGMRPGGE